jgi:septum formation protein
MQPLILASASPRRQSLLSRAGVSFQVDVSGVEERQEPFESPEEFTCRAAKIKAEAVAMRSPSGAWVLSADTSVVVDGKMLGKPKDRADAARMLNLLSGRDHDVLTAVVLMKAGVDVRHTHLSKTKVTFRILNDDIIQGYIGTGEPLDKAGAYGIQGQAAALVQSISGSYTNVVGLPLCETLQLLEKAGVFRLFAGSTAGADDSLLANTGGT